MIGEAGEEMMHRKLWLFTATWKLNFQMDCAPKWYEPGSLIPGTHPKVYPRQRKAGRPRRALVENVAVQNKFCTISPVPANTENL